MTKRLVHMECSECGDYTISTTSNEPIIYCPFCGSETGAITGDDDDWDEDFDAEDSDTFDADDEDE